MSVLSVFYDLTIAKSRRDTDSCRYPTHRGSKLSRNDFGSEENVPADRLKMLQEQRIMVGERSASDARLICCRPTRKGLDLLPVIVEMIIWADQYEETAAPARIMRRMKDDRATFIDEIRRKFSESEKG